MNKIKLTKGKYTIVDDADFEFLNQWKWYLGGQGYAARRIWNKANKTYSGLYLHKLLLVGKEVDHINGDKLDNRRSNLRFCTRSQNQANRPKMCGNSKYKGVSFHTRDKIWNAYIRFQYKLIHLGNFKSDIQAASAYNLAATKYFGEYAKLNPI